MKIGIIGGGAAGLFAACQLKRLKSGKDIDVTLIERNPSPGKKLLLTGHGRCNITNRKDVSELRTGYHEADNFIYPALKEFSPEDTVSFFEQTLGLMLKEEENNRMFPVCESAAAVRDALLTYISDSTSVLCGTTVLDIRKDELFEVETSKGSLSFDSVILACGGRSFPKTGSAGDSYIFAERLGHTIVPLRAALAPVRTDTDSLKFTKALSGVSVNVRATVFAGGKAAVSYRGDMLFADFGITGPAIMELSREIPSDKDSYIEIDFIPDLSDEQTDAKIQSLIRDHSDSKITTLISGFVPASVASAIAGRAGLSGLYAQGFTRENRRKLCAELKHFKIIPDGAPDIDKAYVTRGGVLLKEVDRKTMQSKKVSGLYIIGEALDIDGISGGYNLQACISEAYLASKDLLK